MVYDFDSPINRRGTHSLKWDVKENELPMWVADMDFAAAPEIKAALQKRLDHGIFGYSVVPDEWYDAVCRWWKVRHNFDLDRSGLIFCTGVIPAISSAVRKFTTPAENVVVQTPVYNIFFNSILNNGRRVLESPLVYKNGEYSIDFEDLEEKFALPQTSMMLFCNPHNPVGKIWDAQTLARIGELAKKHHVLVVSDEIHCDLTDPGKYYVPFASVSEACRDNSITCIAPTKAFNLAGLQTAAVYAPNEYLRNKINRALNTDEVAEPNSFAIEGAIAAFNNGEHWLDALRQYLFSNKQEAFEFIRKNIPQIKAVNSQATYLLWLDVSQICEDSEKLQKFIRQNTGLYLSEGSQYGSCGKSFLRMNIACPLSRLKDGLDRLASGIKAFLSTTLR